jgi:GPH family glycoside/pentoside/hexuronide:cation symporter
MTSQATVNIVPPLRAREKLAYGLGDLASNLLFTTITNFLMFYYTEIVGLVAAAVGTMLFAVRALDAVWDISLGVMLDRTRTRWGQCRPYLLFGPVLLGVLAVVCFSAPAIAPGYKLLYAYVTYGLLMMAYSTVNIPYATLPGLMTGDPDERVKLTGVRVICAYCGILVVGLITLPLVQWWGKGSQQVGYQMTVATLAVAATVLFWICFALCRERVPRLVQRNPGVGKDFAVLVRSRNWWVLLAIGIAQWIAVLIPFTSALYYFKYAAGDISLASSFFPIGAVGMISGAWLSGRLTRHFCKRTVWKCALVAAAVFGVLLYLVDPRHTWQVFTIWFLMKAAAAIGAPILWSMVLDVADEIELDSGRRLVGLTTSAIAFSHKFGMGVAAAIGGFMLAAIGYQPDMLPTPAVTMGLRAMMGLVPAAGYAAIAVLLLLYSINRNRLVAIRDALEVSRQPG